MKKLGFGGMRFPLLNPDDKTSIDQEQVNAMADAFLDAGFTYFDTAYLYHDEASEPAFKKALSGAAYPNPDMGSQPKRMALGEIHGLLMYRNSGRRWHLDSVLLG